MNKVKSKPKAKSTKKKLQLVNFKAGARDRRAIKANARKYAKGVVSEYIRMVAVDPFRIAGLAKANSKRAA